MKSDMLNLIIGVAAGFVGGYAVKGQASKPEKETTSGRLYSDLYEEARTEISSLKSKLSSRDAEIDELNRKNKNMVQKLREHEDQADDSADDIQDMKRTIESLRRQNENLKEQMNDYKSLYTAAQQEIDRLK